MTPIDIVGLNGGLLVISAAAIALVWFALNDDGFARWIAAHLLARIAARRAYREIFAHVQATLAVEPEPELTKEK